MNPKDLRCDVCGYMAADFDELRDHNNKEHIRKPSAPPPDTGTKEPNVKHIDYARFKGASHLEVINILQSAGRTFEVEYKRHPDIPYDHVIEVMPITPERARVIVSTGPQRQLRFRPPARTKSILKTLFDPREG